MYFLCYHKQQRTHFYFDKQKNMRKKETAHNLCVESLMPFYQHVAESLALSIICHLFKQMYPAWKAAFFTYLSCL